MKKSIFSIFAISFLLLSVSFSAFAHSGRTDSNGGHKDNKNKSGLGYYHYHCGGYPPHLHPNGVCPYRGGNSSSNNSSSNNSSSRSTPKKVYATKVNVSNMPSTINAGESVALNGSAYPSNAEDQEISWASSNPAIVTVNSSGVLKAVGVGTAVISAKTSRGTTSRFNVTVNEVVAESIDIKNKTQEITIGDSGSFIAVLSPDNTTYKNIVWKSADNSIIEIDANGKYTANAVGKTTISATHKELTDSFEIEVKPILAKSIDISCINKDTVEKLRFEEGNIIELSALVLPENTTDATVKWSVDNTNIAKIDENGIVTAIAEGSVVVTAETINGISDSIEIEIYKTGFNISGAIIVFIISAGVVLCFVFCIIRFRNKYKKS